MALCSTPPSASASTASHSAPASCAASTAAAGLECDYLVVGAGAQALAFVDALLTHDSLCEVIIADIRCRPGGQWNDAYPFARLEYPNVYYGVASKKLNQGKEPSSRATRDELLAYFGSVVNMLLETGRVRYFPMCSVSDCGTRITSLLDPDQVWEVEVRRKTVDSARMGLHPRSGAARPFEAENGTLIVPPQEVAVLSAPHPKYVVMGAGRSGMDTVLWLLSCGVAPPRIYWVMPRDAWLLLREAIEPASLADSAVRGDRSRAKCSSWTEHSLEMEEAGILCRIDPAWEPTANRGQIISKAELRELRRVENVIRLGHVRKVGVDKLALERGAVATGPGTLHIDCTRAQKPLPPRPIWKEGRITLQPLAQLGLCGKDCCGSAALCGALEAVYPNDEERKNSHCVPEEWYTTVEGVMRSFMMQPRRIEVPEVVTWMHTMPPFQTAALDMPSVQRIVRHFIPKNIKAARENVAAILQRQEASAGAAERGAEPTSPSMQADTGAIEKISEPTSPSTPVVPSARKRPPCLDDGDRFADAAGKGLGRGCELMASPATTAPSSPGTSGGGFQRQTSMGGEWHNSTAAFDFEELEREELERRLET